MAFNCKKCGKWKMTENQPCWCDKPVFKGPSLVKKAPKPIPAVSEKKKERVKVNGSEIQHYIKKIVQAEKEKKNFCWVTGKEITKAMLHEMEEEGDIAFVLACFPHILPKGNYPALRYYLNNLGLVWGIENHKKFDLVINKIKEEIGTIQLEKMIKDGKDIYDLFRKHI